MTGNLADLKQSIQTAHDLLDRFQSPTGRYSQSSTNSQVNVLDLAYDTASLIRAQCTKLSLLIINKPFTPSAISLILHELVARPIPGLASAVELCDPKYYTKAMSTELQYRAGRVFAELSKLVAAIPLDGQILNNDAKNGNRNNKGSLAMTGTVWEACDDVMELKNLSIAGLVVQKSEEYRILLKDALEELHEWAEEVSDEEQEYDTLASENQAEDAAQFAVDEIFGSQRHIPLDDPERIRPRLESSMKRLRLLILMYQAVIKHRFKTLPKLPFTRSHESEVENKPPSSIISRVDEALNVLKKIPDITDELANAFYELSVQEIDGRMDECFFAGFGIAELLLENWKGEQDDFSMWALKFQVGMRRGW